MSVAENTAIDMARAPAAAKLLLNMLQRIQIGTLTVTLPGGGHHCYGGQQPGPTAFLEIKSWQACQRILRSGDIGLAEAYRDHEVEIADIPSLLLLAMANEDAIKQAFEGSLIGKATYLFRHFLLNRNTRKGSKRNIHAHYDLGNDFYRLWLDPGMTYSAAIFANPDVSLEQAQTAKYERILAQLNVSAGDHILEIGCGWGGFAEYAARSRGVRVTGISLSKQQLKWATERVKGTAIESLCEFRFQDYRDVTGQFDAVVSIEMIEAVGQPFWPSYFNKINDVLKPGGMAGIQAITIRDDLFHNYSRSTDFIQQFIFPGGMLLSPEKISQQAEKAKLTITDRYAFGPDYAETLRRWQASFEQKISSISQQGFDDAFLRIWRFYYTYCEAGFDAGRTDVYQVMMRKETTD
ncbi:MAG: cyclopropane-fatty-acyl-phospholipid synthase family protein [Moraxellaceae bacterium]|nr:cyclopropane-fatty-acyl-phospholipid synthase family protein [Moraxellaceae bacterium]